MIHLSVNPHALYDAVIYEAIIEAIGNKPICGTRMEEITTKLDGENLFREVQKITKNPTREPMLVFAPSPQNRDMRYVIVDCVSDGLVAQYEVWGSCLIVSVISSKLDIDKEFKELLVKFDGLKLIEQDTDDGIWIIVTHWQDQHGQPVRRDQFVKAPRWKDIHDNYPVETRTGIDRIMKMERPTEHGKLAIWNGTPGTGKTYAVRSLMMEWKKYFKPILVTDPEVFCEKPGYFYQLADMFTKDDKAEYDEATDKMKPGGIHRSPLIIFEDAAILLMREERAINSKMIGKLLNMTDGILGQGMDAVFMITFNEPLETIDSAFTRPGRCLSAVNFRGFGDKEASEWTKKRGVNDMPLREHTRLTTLAELYEHLAANKK